VGIPGISGNALAIGRIFDFFYKHSILGNSTTTKRSNLKTKSG